MDRETILKKAQGEKDEMVEQTRDKAMKWTYLVLVLSAAVFAFVRGMRDEPIMDLCATVNFSVFAGRVYCYVKTKQQYDLVMAIITIAIAVVATVRFFMGH